jgi:hypothetical protein
MKASHAPQRDLFELHLDLSNIWKRLSETSGRGEVQGTEPKVARKQTTTIVSRRGQGYGVLTPEKRNRSERERER